MALISKAIPNLIGGVSQQPEAIRFDNQAERQDNAYPSVLEGLIKRVNTDHVGLVTGTVGSDTDEYFTHVINRDPTEQYAVVVKGGTSTSTMDISPLDGTANPTIVAPAGFDYLNVPSGFKAATALRAITIADYTFFVNRTTTVSMTDKVVNPTTPQGMVWIKRGDYGTSYGIEATSDATGDVVFNVGHLTPDGDTPTDRQDIDTAKIAKSLRVAISAVSGVEFSASNPGDGGANGGTVIWIRRKGTGIFQDEPFDLSVSDGLGGTAAVLIKDEISNLSDLPTTGRNNFRVKVIGDADDERDDYYVKFVAKNADFGSGYWEETVATDIPVQLNAATMPHVLIRTADGNFRFGPADGSTYTIGDDSYTMPLWGEQTVGDKQTNSDPTFVNKTINDVFLFKNRLGFLSDENVIMSESGEFFNFYRTTISQLLDTAPIDVSSTDSRVSILTAAVPFARQLVLFAEQSQFVLQSGNNALTPQTVSMTKTTSFDAVSQIRPFPLGNSIYFGFTRGEFAGVRQYYIANDTDTIFDATDVSAQIPRYIPGNVRDIAGCSQEDLLVLSTNTDRNVLYFYKFYDSNQDRIQSAWSRLVFGSADEVLGIEFIDTTLYIMVKRADGIYLDKMEMEPGLVDANSTYRTLLDRRVQKSDCTVSGDGLTITLPFKTYTGETYQVITKDGRLQQVTTQTNDSNQLVMSSSVAAEDFWVGRSYTMTYEFSPPVLREATQAGGSASISEGRLQVRYLRIDHADSAFYNLTITPEYRQANNYPMTGRFLGSGKNLLGKVALENGQLRVPVYSKADQVTIVASNNSPLPCKLTSAEFEMSFNPRSQRFS